MVDELLLQLIQPVLNFVNFDCRIFEFVVSEEVEGALDLVLGGDRVVLDHVHDLLSLFGLEEVLCVLVRSLSLKAVVTVGGAVI